MGDVINMVVPINPFLSSSREEGKTSQDSKLTAHTEDCRFVRLEHPDFSIVLMYLKVKVTKTMVL